MATFAIGDVQGCYTALEALLEKIKFNRAQDTLWFTGDLVNRGPSSLQVLRFISKLGDRQITVLGNHDIHLIAIYYGVRKATPKDTLGELLAAPDCDDLIAWLRCQSLLHYDSQLNVVMAHAGLAPIWTLQEAARYAHEIETVLRASEPAECLPGLFGNEPAQWSSDLQGVDRLRCIVNYLTRMRLCHSDGRLDFAFKGPLSAKPPDLIPWFELPRRTPDVKIIFGHWAALCGVTHVEKIFSLDTGCVWGNCLTAMRLEDGERFSVSCAK